MIQADLIVTGASELATPLGDSPMAGADQDKLEVIKNGVVASMEGKIVFVGSVEEAEELVELVDEGIKVDADGGTILPGFVDPHTHTVFAGDRAEEFDLRMKGHSYADIAKRGGGILSTVKATREASLEELVDLGLERLDSMLVHGTTTVEIKSGYGLDTETELKMLRAIKHLSEEHELDVVPTFMGAHEVPPEFRGVEDGTRKFADLVIEEMLPAVKAEGLARFFDVFTETGVFEIEDSRRMFQAAREAGMEVRVHADELTPLGGAELAAEMGCVSADHLLHISDKGIKMMADSGTIAGLLPGTAFFLMMKDYAPARRIIEGNVPVALATDFNPGSSHCESMPMTITLACLNMKMTAAEAIVASTLNSACALKMGDEVGSLETGKKADIIILDAPSHFHLVYHWGVNPVKTVIKEGELVWSR